MQRIVLTSVFLFSLKLVLAQDVLLPLQMNPHLFGKDSEQSLKAGAVISIQVDLDSSKYIIIDDFSYNSYRPNNRIWKDRSVYINRNFPINPISIGVATFDGLDEFGYPYNFVKPTSYGPCDTLTTLPIDMGNVDLSVDDPVYLTFYYQPQGLNPFANSSSDSLTLQFYQRNTYDTTIAGNNPPIITIDTIFIDRWINVWGRAGYDLQNGDITCNGAFRPKTIAIPPILHQDSFQFRFISYGNTSGNVDHWHLDYVILSSDAKGHSELEDITFISEIGSLITEYESMPWFHYVGNEARYARTKPMIYKLRNTSGAEVNFNIEYRTDDAQGNQVDSITISLLPRIPAKACIDQDMPEFTNHTFIFPSSSAPVNSTTYFLKKTKMKGVPGQNLIKENDEVHQYQIFGTYYAYDDGSAEAGYGVKSKKGQVAVQFIMPPGITDTLTSFYIHFNPVVEDRSDERFRLTVWGNNNGEPGNVLFENSSVSSPVYPKYGVNYFNRWFLDASVMVSDTFYIGYQKITEDVLNIGYDLNRKRNEKLFFSIGAGWINAANGGSVKQNGSLMIRPSFRTLDEPVVGIIKPAEIVDLKYKLKLFPNPVFNRLSVRIDQPVNNNWNGQVFSIEGKLIQSFIFNGQTELDVSNYPKGMYILQLIDTKEGNMVHGKFLVAR